MSTSAAEQSSGLTDIDQADGENGQQSSLMADVDQTDGENELVVVAGGALAAPYLAQSKKRKRAADATIYENEPGLHAFARACFGRLRAPLPRIALPAPLDARTAAGEAVAAAVARGGDSREPLRPVNETYTLDEVVDQVLQGP